MKNLYLGCAMIAALLFAPTLSMASVAEVAPANDFEGVGYSVTSSGTVVVFAGLREIGNKTAVCGIVWFEKTVSNTTKVIEPKFTDQINFSVNGKRLRVNSKLFIRYDSKDAAKAGVARCSVTATPWSPAYAKAKVSMKLGRITVTD